MKQQGKADWREGKRQRHQGISVFNLAEERGILRGQKNREKCKFKPRNKTKCNSEIMQHDQAIKSLDLKKKKAHSPGSKTYMYMH